MSATRFLSFLVMLLPASLPMRAETTTLSLLPAGAASPIRFETDSSQVIDMAGGKMITGDLFLVTPIARIKLAGSSVLFEYAPGTQRIERLRGIAFVPSPLDNAFVTIRRPAVAELGLDQGKNLSLGVPLNSDRYYLYFRFNAGFGMDIGTGGGADDTKALSLDIPAGVNATLVLDPLDPFYYFSGAIITPKTNAADSNRKPKPDGKLEDNFAKLGKGTSYQGLIPFRPATTYGVEDKVQSFSGERILVGTFQLPDLPILATGYKIDDTAPADGESGVGLFGVEILPFQQAGVNADLQVSYSFLKLAKLGKIANFSFPLGTATAAYQLTNGVQQAYISGVLKPDTSWIPDIIPITPRVDGHAFGYLSSKLTDFRLHVDSEFALDTSNFGELSGIHMGDLLRVTGRTSISADGYRLTGEAFGGLGPLGEADRKLDTWMPFTRDDGYIEAEGSFRVVTLSVLGRGRVSKEGVRITGRWSDSREAVDISALMSNGPQGPFVTGTMTVPPSWQPDFQKEIRRLASDSRATVASSFSELEAATKNYEFELSLRGLRTAIPPICDAIISEIDSRIRAEAPGIVEADALSKAEPYRRRLRNLKTAVQSSDNATTRAAVKAAIQAVLNNQRLRITEDLVLTTIVIVDQDFISADSESKLRTAMSAVDALPAASSRKVSAETVWAMVPKEEILQTVDQTIQSSSSAIPRITAVGFSQPLLSTPLTLFADVALGSQTGRVSVDYDPQNPLALPIAIASKVRSGLSAGTIPAPAGPETSTKVPVITAGSVSNGASLQGAIAPGSWATIYGINLSATTRAWRPDEIRGGVLPTSLDGVSVLIDGKSAAISYISPTQINVLVPANIRVGSVPVQVSGSLGVSASVTAASQGVAPAFFAWQATGGTRFAAATDLNYQPLGPTGLLPGANPRAAKPGEAIILWGTGFGAANPSQVLLNTPIVTVGGVEAELLGAALSPGFAGLYQIAVRIPDAVEGDLPVVAAAGGFTSPPGFYLHVER